MTKRQVYLCDVISSIFCFIALIFMIPVLINIINSPLGINFQWWEKLSFFFGPIAFFVCAIFLGLRGIKGLQNG